MQEGVVITMFSDPILKIFFFGGFRILVNDIPMNLDSWKSKKALELLKYLLYRKGKKISKEQLLELLWPDSSNLHNLHTVIYYIRKKLREITGNKTAAFIQYSQGNYYFDENTIKWIDCFELEELFRIGAEIEKTNPERALQEYRKALSIYTDHFLADDIYHDWTMNIRQHYMDLVSRIIIRAVNILSACGDDSEAINICKNSLKYNFNNEEIYYNLIKLLIRNGELLAATEFYQDYSRFVSEEYDMELSSRFYELFEENNIYIKEDNGFQYNDEISSEPFLCDKRLFSLLYKLAVKRVKRYGEYFSIIYIRINGNTVREIKQYLIHICRKRLREGDLICHWSKKSLMLYLHMVDKDESYQVKERLLGTISRNLIEKLFIKIITVNANFIETGSCVFLADMIK
ncbi:MAG: hypothetical protein GX175_02085 [Halanaerobiaceae bacterium]|nr:hypothetical protein [Halanaerobiaceae bacterium]